MYFGNIAGTGGLGRFVHFCELSPLDNQTVVRLNRDTLYSSVLFDLEAGPVTVTLPDAGKRFMSLQVITEDHYAPEVIYTQASTTFTPVRTSGPATSRWRSGLSSNPNDPADLKAVHALQDAMTYNRTARAASRSPTGIR